MDLQSIFRILSIFGDQGNKTALDFPIMSDDPRTGGITGNMPMPTAMPNIPTPNPSPPSMSPDNVLPPVHPGLGMEEPDENRILDMYKPDNRAHDMLFSLLQRFPERPKPSIGRSLLAATAAGLTRNPAVGEDVQYGDYNRQVEDYNARLRPLSILAQMERGDNSNERAMAIAAMRDRIAQKRVDIAEKKAQEQAEIARKKNEIALKVQQMKEAQGRYLFKVGDDGFLYAVDKTDPKQPAIKTDVHTNDLDRLELAQLTHGYRLSEIRATGEEARKTAETRGEQARETKETVPGKNTNPTGKAGESGRAMSELEKQRLIRSNYQKIISDNPDFAKEFEFDVNKLPHLKKGTKLTPADQATLNRRLHNGVPGPADTSGQDVSAPKTVAPKTTEERVEVINPKGKKVTIPKSQLQEALKPENGYRMP